MAKPTTVSDVNGDRESDERAKVEITIQIDRHLKSYRMPVPFSNVMNRLTGKPSLKNLSGYGIGRTGSEEQLRDYDNAGDIEDPNLGKPTDTILQYSPDAVVDVLHMMIKNYEVFYMIGGKQKTEFPDRVKMLITIVSSELGDKYEYDGKSEMMLISKENVASCLKFLELRKNGGNSGTRYRDDEE